MENKFEKITPVLEQEYFQKFIQRKNISPDDFGIIEKLSLFPKDTIIENMHNFFSAEKEKSVSTLKSLIERTREKIAGEENAGLKKIFEERIKLFDLFLTFCEKYGWDASWGLVRALEEKK